MAAFKLTVRTAVRGYHVYKNSNNWRQIRCLQEPDNDKAGYASSTENRREILRERLLHFGRLSLLSLQMIDDGLSSRSGPQWCLGLHIPQQTLPNFRPFKRSGDDSQSLKTIVATKGIWIQKDKDTNEWWWLFFLATAISDKHLERFLSMTKIRAKWWKL